MKLLLASPGSMSALVLPSSKKRIVIFHKYYLHNNTIYLLLTYFFILFFFFVSPLFANFHHNVPKKIQGNKFMTCTS